MQNDRGKKERKLNDIKHVPFQWEGKCRRREGRRGGGTRLRFERQRPKWETLHPFLVTETGTACWAQASGSARLRRPFDRWRHLASTVPAPVIRPRSPLLFKVRWFSSPNLSHEKSNQLLYLDVVFNLSNAMRHIHLLKPNVNHVIITKPTQTRWRLAIELHAWGPSVC